MQTVTTDKPTPQQTAFKIALGVVGTLAGVLVIVALLWILVHYAYVQPQIAGQMTDAERFELLAATRAEDQQLLTTYGWMDASKGVVRIPVEQAMQKLVEEQGAARQ